MRRTLTRSRGLRALGVLALLLCAACDGESYKGEDNTCVAQGRSNEVHCVLPPDGEPPDEPSTESEPPGDLGDDDEPSDPPKEDEPTPGSTKKANPSEPVKIKSVDVGLASDYRVPRPGVYKLSKNGGPRRSVRFNWKTVTNYGILDAECFVEVKATSVETGQIQWDDDSRSCSRFEGGSFMTARDLTEGSYKIVVTVTLQSGDSKSGSVGFRVIP